MAVKVGEFKKLVAERLKTKLADDIKAIDLDCYVRDALKGLGDNNYVKVLPSLVNHFEKMVTFIENTSEKTMSTPCALCDSEKLNAAAQKWEAFRAVLEFLRIACVRNSDGIRNAYISFTRPRKQKIVRSVDNPEGAREGRPNLYQSEKYRYVVNRANKLKRNRKK